MNKGVILIIVGVVLIILSFVSGFLAVMLPVGMMEYAYAEDFTETTSGSDTVYTYTFQDIGPGDLSVEVSLDYYGSYSVSSDWTVVVTGANAGQLGTDSGSDILLELTLSKKDDVTITVTGDPDPYIDATYTGKHFMTACYAGCGGFFFLLFLGIIVLIVGIVVAVKSRPAKTPAPPAYMQGQQQGYPQQRPPTVGTSAGQSPYGGQYYQYPPQQQAGQYPGYPPQQQQGQYPQGKPPGYP
jgi:hypothetical protein